MKNWKNILLTVLTVLMLVGFAAVMTSPSITEEARQAHMNEGVDDEYAFLFD